MKKNIKNQRGAVSIFVLLSMMFFLAFMLGAFTLVNRRNAAQVEALSETQRLYATKTSAKDYYNSIFASESAIVPIMNYNQLRDAIITVNSTDEDPIEFKYLMNNKVYTYKKDANYILQNDIILDYEDIVDYNTKVKGNSAIDLNKIKEILKEITELETEHSNIRLDNSSIYYTNADGNLCKLEGPFAYFRESGAEGKTFENNINIISKSNLAKYLGKKVKYNPNNSGQFTYSSNTYATSSTYRLFYVDFNNKYGDGDLDGDNKIDATIYLKADYTNNFYDLQLINSNNLPEGNKTLQLNPLWNEKIENGFYSINTIFKDSENNIKNKNKAVAWLLEPSVWNTLKDNSERLSGKINYVVGTPSLEMYVDSYNTYLESNPTILNGGGNQAKQLACEYVIEGEKGVHGHQNHETEGYMIGFKDDPEWDYWDYENYPITSSRYINYYSLEGNGGGLKKNDLVSSSVCNGMYNPGKQNNNRRNAWIASPSSSWFAYNGIQNEKYKRVISILGEDNDTSTENQSRISNEWYTFNGGSVLTFSPIVSIKYDSQLAFSE